MICSPLLSAMRYPCRYVPVVSRISTTIDDPLPQCTAHPLSYTYAFKEAADTVRSGFPLELPFPRFVASPQLLRARPTGTHPVVANAIVFG